MDSKQFDSLARTLATGTSRRRALRALAGSVASGGLLAALGGRGAAADTVVICHLTGSDTSPVVLIEVDASAVPAHEAHGDAINPDFDADPAHCGACGRACEPGERCVAGECESCGGLDQDCCPDLSCDAGLRCTEFGTCRDCGEVGEPCCITFAFLICDAGAVCADDGGGQGQCIICDVNVNPECAPQGND